MWYCMKCGTGNDPDVNFCKMCGTRKGQAGKSFDPKSVIIIACVIIIAIMGAMLWTLWKRIPSPSPVIPTPPVPTLASSPVPTPVPTPVHTYRPTPTPKPTPGPGDMRGANESVVYPNSYNWLRDYEAKYVKTKYGICAYLRYEPSEDSDYYSYVYEKDCVIVLARQNGYSLVEDKHGNIGWVTNSVLVDYY